MRVVEFRIPLPVPLSQLFIAQQWSMGQVVLENFVKAIDLNSTDSSKVIYCNITLDDEGNLVRQNSKRVFSLADSLPSWMLRFIDPNILNITETSDYSFPDCSTHYSLSRPKSQIRIEFHTSHVVGRDVPEGWIGPTSLPDELREKAEVVFIDCLNDSTKTFMSGPYGGEGTISPGSKFPFTAAQVRCEQLGWSHLGSGWLKQYQGEIVIACKSFILDLNVLGAFASAVEDFVVNAMKKEMLSFHRKLIWSAPQWASLTLKDIFNIDIFTKKTSDELRALQAHIVSKIEVPEPPEGRSPEEFHKAWKRWKAGNQYREVIQHFIKVVDKTNDGEEVKEISDIDTISDALVLSQILIANPKAVSTNEARDIYACSRDTEKHKLMAATASLTAQVLPGDSDLVIYKLSYSFGLSAIIKPTWSRRYVTLRDAVFLSYYGSHNKPEGNEVPRLRVALDSATIRYSDDREELFGRTHGVVIEKKDAWTGTLVFSGETDKDSRELTVRLQVMSEGILSPLDAAAERAQKLRSVADLLAENKKATDALFSSLEIFLEREPIARSFLPELRQIEDRSERFMPFSVDLDGILVRFGVNLRMLRHIPIFHDWLEFSKGGSLHSQLTNSFDISSSWKEMSKENRSLILYFGGKFFGTENLRISIRKVLDVFPLQRRFFMTGLKFCSSIVKLLSFFGVALFLVFIVFGFSMSMMINIIFIINFLSFLVDRLGTIRGQMLDSSVGRHELVDMLLTPFKRVQPIQFMVEESKSDSFMMSASFNLKRHKSTAAEDLTFVISCLRSRREDVNIKEILRRSAAFLSLKGIAGGGLVDVANLIRGEGNLSSLSLIQDFNPTSLRRSSTMLKTSNDGNIILQFSEERCWAMVPRGSHEWDSFIADKQGSTVIIEWISLRGESLAEVSEDLRHVVALDTILSGVRDLRKVL